jgi:hypothetical protein
LFDPAELDEVTHAGAVLLLLLEVVDGAPGADSALLLLLEVVDGAAGADSALLLLLEVVDGAAGAGAACVYGVPGVSDCVNRKGNSAAPRADILHFVLLLAPQTFYQR